MSELLPCPFCKGRATREGRGWGENRTMIGCTILVNKACKFHPHVIIPTDEAEKAIKAWNTRAADQCAHDKPLPDEPMGKSCATEHTGANVGNAANGSDGATIDSAALTNAKPVDHAPLGGEPLIWQLAHLRKAIWLCEQHYSTSAKHHIEKAIAALTQPHDLLKDARDALANMNYYAKLIVDPRATGTIHPDKAMSQLKVAEQTFRRLNAVLPQSDQHGEV